VTVVGAGCGGRAAATVLGQWHWQWHVKLLRHRLAWQTASGPV